jgi:hypothetical protein
MLLAWKWRRTSPFVDALTWQIGGDGAGIQIQMMPRSYWEEDPRFLDSFGDAQRDKLRNKFSETSFCPNTNFVYTTSIVYQDTVRSIQSTCNFITVTIRGTEIVEALTSTTRAEDLGDALAWFGAHPSRRARELLEDVRNRYTRFHGGSIVQPDSSPVPSRAYNNEVAYMMLDVVMNLTFEIQLRELSGAAHLNSREGVIRGQDPTNHERWRARLDGGTYVSVKAANFVHVRRGEYKRKPP